MLRKGGSASSMQKTYDECYLICSTAIYFEGQNNEKEALRSWRSALDQIYYHNAYKMPSNYTPRSETEKALHESLRSMELQCKERVDLFEALKKSRKEAEEDARNEVSRSRESLASINRTMANGEGASGGGSGIWLGGDTIPPVTYSDLPRAYASPAPQERRPPPPSRPSYGGARESNSTEIERSKTVQPPASPALTPPVSTKERARTPSPEKKAGGMLKTLRANQKERPGSGKMATSMRPKAPPAAARAATQVWTPQSSRASSNVETRTTSNTTSSPPPTSWDPYTRSLAERPSNMTSDSDRQTSDQLRPPSPSDYIPQGTFSDFDSSNPSRAPPPPYPDYHNSNTYNRPTVSSNSRSHERPEPSNLPPPPPPHRSDLSRNITDKPRPPPPDISKMDPPSMAYMKEFPNHPPLKPALPEIPGKRTTPRGSDTEGPSTLAPPKTVQAKTTPAVPRKAVGGTAAAGRVSAIAERQKLDGNSSSTSSAPKPPTPRRRKPNDTTTTITPNNHRSGIGAVTPPTTSESGSHDSSENDPPNTEKAVWDAKVSRILANLPRGVDETAAKQIFNEIVIQGDEVHWSDVAGLEIAKSALKETVVYPFLRPDLFMGLREPARGMLLFGPPGTGKTMLARAVATESRSVFFAISASSLTSKFLGESEKLVRALFGIAKVLAPSIIFVDEIDSLLGSRGGSSEHEATRRIKTEFLIQWSDLQKAAAGSKATPTPAGGGGGGEGDEDASRVLVLAATNTPWAIDEAARRRFVRRQYIPLPEPFVREQQLRTLLSHQKHNLTDADVKRLVELTEGFSGSDITALAKDAAMGPLRSLGERLLGMRPEEIRGIEIGDFRGSLDSIRPSVGREGLKQYEQWAAEFGERGG